MWSAALQVVATFALLYHLVASKRHLCAHLQKNCVSTLNSMTATADRLMAWVKLAKTHNGVWCACNALATRHVTVHRCSTANLRSSAG